MGDYYDYLLGRHLMNQQDAEGWSLKSEGFAKGTQNNVPVASGSPYYENNSKYYSEVAGDIKTEMEGLLDNVAMQDGNYESMTVGTADQLLSNAKVTDQEPYLFRTAGGSADIGDREEDTIVGVSLPWNQYIKELEQGKWSKDAGVTATFSDGVATISSTTAGNGIAMGVTIPTYLNHKYFICADVKSSNEYSDLRAVVSGSSQVRIQSMSTVGNTNTWVSYKKIINETAPANAKYFYIYAGSGVGAYSDVNVRNVMVIDLTLLFGSTIADYIYTLETTTTGAGVSYFKKLFPKPYYPYCANSLLSMNVSKHIMNGFNQWDEEWEVGGINSSGENTGDQDRIRSKNYIKCLPSTTYYYQVPIDNMSIYYYDADKNCVGYYDFNPNHNFTTPSNCYYMRFKTAGTYGTTYHNDICINLSWDGSRDGEYEPYESYSYDLDSSLELNGILKLEANNDLYSDGDVYKSDGTVERRYVKVTLNGSTPESDIGVSSQTGFTQISYLPYIDSGIGNAEVRSNVFTYADWETSRIREEKNIGLVWTSAVPRIFLGLPTTVTSRADAINWFASNPTELVFPIATPTTESADPYTNPQICNDFGTEEYVVTSQDGVEVPVGHITKYPVDLKAKLEMAPNSPDGDGYYLVKQTNGVNEYVQYIGNPEAPNEDGNYYLKCTVSSGSATYSWESQS